MSAIATIQSVDRALGILEAVVDSADGLTLAALSHRMGLGKTTVHNLARTLVERGYLAKLDAPRRYVLGEAVDRLGRAREQAVRRSRAAEAVRNLAASVPDATVTWSQARRGQIEVVYRMSPERPGVLQVPEAFYLGVYTSASGLVFQAFWDGEQRRQCEVQFPFEEYGLGAWGDRARFARAVAEVREAQLACRGGEGSLLRVAAPVFSRGEELVAVLGASLSPDAGSSRSTSEADVVAHVREAAGSIR
jgi:DNA-binding IclR family transcriptional regulator